jgi:NitT/TauT family transport system ATP-binding protein
LELECIEVSKAYGDPRSGSSSLVRALDRVSFKLESREILSIVGPSGCGKSTLLRILADLVQPDAGAVKRAPNGDGRPSNALVFQEHALFPWMTIVDNVAFGLRMRGADRRASTARAAEFLDRIGLAGFAARHPHELSVGMRQRVNLARAFLVDPRVLLLDEPFAALDAQTRLLLTGELLESFERSHKSVIYVTHDIEEAIVVGDRVLVMSGRPGRIIDEIPVPLPRPRDAVVRSDPRIGEIEARIWRQLESEVKRGLEAPG